MSWLFSRALVEAYSLGNPSDGRASALLNQSLTALGFSPKDKTMDFSRLSRSGAISEHSMDALGGDVLMWLAGASRAKTYPLRDQVKELAADEADSGRKWQESFAKYDPDSHSWKTRQCSVLGGLEEFSETWPRWGSMRNGECWEQTTWATTTGESESGLLPTVTVCGNYNRVGASQTSGDGVSTVWRRLTGSFPTAEMLEVLMGLPAGWTALEPLGMRKFPSAQQPRSSKAVGG